MTDYILHYAPDNASCVIRWVLYELDQPFDTQLVDRRTHQHRSPAYLALNPAGRIPTLETPQGPISETAAILLWLTNRHGQLAPAQGTAAYARFLNTLLFVANTLHPDAIQSFYLHRYGPEHALPDMRQALQKHLTRHLTVLDQHYATHQPGFDVVTPYLAMTLRWLTLYPNDAPRWLTLSQFPALHEVCLAAQARPAFQRAAADEGLGATPLTDPQPAQPPEGSAT